MLSSSVPAGNSADGSGGGTYGAGGHGESRGGTRSVKFAEGAQALSMFESCMHLERLPESGF